MSWLCVAYAWYARGRRHGRRRVTAAIAWMMSAEPLFLTESGDRRNDGHGPGRGDLLSELDEKVLGEFELDRIPGCDGDGASLKI